MFYVILIWKAFWVLASIVTVGVSVVISNGTIDTGDEDEDLKTFLVSMALASISVCIMVTAIISWITYVHFILYFLIGFAAASVVWQIVCRRVIEKYNNGEIAYDELETAIESRPIISSLLSMIVSWPVFAVIFFILLIKDDL